MLKDNPPYERLNKLGKLLSTGIKEVANQKGIALQVPQTGSMFCLFFSQNPVLNYEQALASEVDSFKKIFQSCLANGIYLPPSPYETCFISASHGEDEISKTIEQVALALS
jgi:glutamate-1-semialdehyde 2,1-aminomutase